MPTRAAQSGLLSPAFNAKELHNFPPAEKTGTRWLPKALHDFFDSHVSLKGNCKILTQVHNQNTRNSRTPACDAIRNYTKVSHNIQK